MIKKEIFGNIPASGGGIYAYTEYTLYTLSNASGMSVKILNLGGTVVEINVPDRNGRIQNINAGYDSPQAYLSNDGYLGAIIGRVAGRIAGASFTLGGKEYKLYANNGANHLHGGRTGFDRRLWQAETREEGGEAALVLEYFSPDGEEGYPGDLSVRVTYTLGENNRLSIHYRAEAGSLTAVDLTNHAYFNLSGDFSRDILSHELEIDADRYAEHGAGLLPTGRLPGVAGTPLDFRRAKPVGRDIGADDAQLAIGGGYDHCFMLNNPGPGSAPAAVLYDPGSGRRMRVYTDQPCVQFYSANMLRGGTNLSGGVPRTPRCALCLETQHIPGSVNVTAPGFTDITLEAGQIYDHTTVFEFDVLQKYENHRPQP